MRQPGDRIGRYVIVGLLGRGGMGEVYEAEDSLLGRRVALKLIPHGADADARERMLREARTAAGFEHPNVVLVFDVGVVEDEHGPGETFLAMELVRGRTLRSVVRDKEVSLGKKLRWLIDVARALDAAHGAGLVHRDIKPDNLMVRDDGVIKVLDFGIAKKKTAVDPSAPTNVAPDPITLTKAGSIIGTPRYASPEQLRGEPLDGRADQYSWGVTAYELVSGHAPFEADDPVTLLSRILTTEPVKLRILEPEVPEEVEKAIHRTLQKRREDRFEKLEPAAEIIEPFADAPFASGERRSMLSEHPVKTPPPSVVIRAAKTSFRIFFYIAAALGTFIILAVVIGAFAGKFVFTPPGRTSASASASAHPASQPRARIVRCSDATISGPEASPELAHMMGIGACARLAVTVGLGWEHDKAIEQGASGERVPLAVTVALGDTTRVTLKLGPEEGSGESTSPTVAMQSAVSALATRVLPPPMTDEERAGWGASTDESGRRVERMWRRLFVNDLLDAEAESKALAKSDPDSPWSHAILALVSQRGSKTSLDATEQLRQHLDRVSGARKKGLSALASILEKPNPDESIRELRQAYGDAPDDAEIAGLYAAIAANVVASDEGFSVVDRLAERFPTHALLALQNAVTAPPRHDLERDARYLTRLIEIYPEFRCSDIEFENLIVKNQLDEAREAVKECTLFFGSAAGDYGIDFKSARVALASGDFDQAHDIAVKRLGDPRSSTRTEAAQLVIGSRLAAGRLVEAEETLKSELARQRDQESPLVAMRHAHAILRLHRRLGTKAPPEIVAWLGETNEKSASTLSAQKLSIEAEVSLARGDSPKAQDELLARVDKLGDPTVALTALPLVRARRGDKGALELLRSSKRPADGARRLSAIDAALTLEASHASVEEVAEALRPLNGPYAVDVIGFDRAVGEAILARALDAAGKREESASTAKRLEKRFAKADKGLLETIGKLK